MVSDKDAFAPRQTVLIVTLGLVAFSLIALLGEIYFWAQVAAPWIDQRIGSMALVLISVVGGQLSLWILGRVWVRVLRHYKFETHALRLAKSKEKPE